MSCEFHIFEIEFTEVFGAIRARSETFGHELEYKFEYNMIVWLFSQLVVRPWNRLQYLYLRRSLIVPLSNGLVAHNRVFLSKSNEVRIVDVARVVEHTVVVLEHAVDEGQRHEWGGFPAGDDTPHVGFALADLVQGQRGNDREFVEYAR